MKNWQIIGAITLLVFAVAAWRILSYEHERNSPGIVANRPAQRVVTEDQLTFVRKMLIDSVKSARVLNDTADEQQMRHVSVTFANDKVTSVASQ